VGEGAVVCLTRDVVAIDREVNAVPGGCI